MDVVARQSFGLNKFGSSYTSPCSLELNYLIHLLFLSNGSSSTTYQRTFLKNPSVHPSQRRAAVRGSGAAF